MLYLNRLKRFWEYYRIVIGVFWSIFDNEYSTLIVGEILVSSMKSIVLNMSITVTHVLAREEVFVSAELWLLRWLAVFIVGIAVCCGVVLVWRARQ